MKRQLQTLQALWSWRRLVRRSALLKSLFLQSVDFHHIFSE